MYLNLDTGLTNIVLLAKVSLDEQLCPGKEVVMHNSEAKEDLVLQKKITARTTACS